jgi:chromosome partitioning protein
MRRIAIALSKGGVGKTTTAVNLAAGLVQQGRRVLMVDADTQGQAARMLGVQGSYSLAEVAAGDVAPAAALVEARPGLWLMPGGRGLAGLKRVIDRKEFGGEHTIREALAPLDDRFDYAIVDTAPGWDALAVNALFYVDEVLAPVSLEVLALQGLFDFTQNLRSLQQYHERLNLRYVLPTFFDRRVRKSEEIHRQLQTHFGAQLCQPIRYSVRLSEAPGFGQTIYEYAAGSPGADDYEKLTTKVLQDE